MAIQLSVKDGIARVTLSNPPLNLLSNQIKSELHDVFKRITGDEKIRVIFINAEGEHFCCGANLKEFPERIRNRAAGDAWDSGHEYVSTIINAPQITVACVKGNALGGGAELASTCDIRIFADNVKIGYPEILRGVFPGNGGLERFIDLVGEAQGMRLLLTGEIITAEEAKLLGLANKVVPVPEVQQCAEDYVKTLANLPGIALKTIKKAVKLYRTDPNSFLDKGRELFSLVHETEDVIEAVNSFFEKRKPHYQHR